MKELRWGWSLVAFAIALMLLSTAANGGWLFVSSVLLIGGIGYAVIQLALRRGYEWRMKRGLGIVMVPVMIVVLLVVSQIIGSFEIGALLGLVGGYIALLAVGLKRPSNIYPER